MLPDKSEAAYMAELLMA